MLMQFISFLWRLCIVYIISSAQAENLSGWESNVSLLDGDFDSTLEVNLRHDYRRGLNPISPDDAGYEFNEDSNSESTRDIFDDDLWGLDSTDQIDAANGLAMNNLFASNPCSLSISPLGRRSESCTNTEQGQELEPEPPDMSVEVRPLGKTKDSPLLPFQHHPELCPFDLMTYSRVYVMCDSGKPTDLYSSPIPGSTDLGNCTPCIGWPRILDSLCADLLPVDILAGCFSPSRVWCCSSVDSLMEKWMRVNLVTQSHYIQI